MTPLDIVSQSREDEGEAVASQDIQAVLRARRDQMHSEMSRGARRTRREAQWRMHEVEALLHCTRHGSVPVYALGGEETEAGEEKNSKMWKEAPPASSYMTGRAVLADLAEESDFAELLDAAALMCSEGEGGGSSGNSGTSRGNTSLLEIAVRNFHVEMVEILLPHASTSSQRRAAVIAEGIISGLVVDGELECLSRRRGQHRGGWGKGGSKRGRKRMDDEDADFDGGEAHSRRAAGPNLGCMTSILRLLRPNHMLFVEERLRKRERVRDGMKELQGAGEKPIVCGIDTLLLDPKEEEKVAERVAKRANARRLKQQRRARRLVEKNNLEADLLRHREKARRHNNAQMLLDGRAFDVKKKKFWFETGWTAERFMVPLTDAHREEEEEGGYGHQQEEQAACCCVVS
jgi:hypothetical protein